MSFNRLKIFIPIVIIILVGVVVLINHLDNQYGYANIDFSLPDIQNLHATINGKPLDVTGLTNLYKLHSGSEKLVVNKPEYKQLETSFSLGTNQTVYVDVPMISVAPQSSVIATGQLQTTLLGFLPQGFTINQTTFFYDNSWVVAVAQTTKNDMAILVAKYVGGDKSWDVVLGPGTVFFPTDLVNLPSGVALYLSQQHHVLGGS